jgi:regulator of replication initiation timing
MRDGPVLDVNRTAKYLAGIAFVKYASDTRVPDKIKTELGLNLGCWGGAVRLYRPFVDGISGFNPYWDRNKIQNERFFDMLLQEVCKWASYTASESEFEKIRERRDRVNICRLAKEKTNREELIRAYETRIADLEQKAGAAEMEKAQVWQECLGLSERLEVSIGDCETLQTKVDKLTEQERLLTLQNQGYIETIQEMRKTQAQAPSAPVNAPRREYTSLDEVLDTVKNEMPNIVITGKADRTAKDSRHYNDLQGVYNAFEWMRDIFLITNRGTQRFDLEVTAQERCGMQYAGNQSSITMNRYYEDYHATYEGREFELSKHLKKGNSPDGSNSIRIAFAYDEREGGRVIVGYISPHQTNPQS